MMKDVPDGDLYLIGKAYCIAPVPDFSKAAATLVSTDSTLGEKFLNIIRESVRSRIKRPFFGLTSAPGESSKSLEEMMRLERIASEPIRESANSKYILLPVL